MKRAEVMAVFLYGEKWCEEVSVEGRSSVLNVEDRMMILGW